jgi:lactoylglutathione lyase
MAKIAAISIYVTDLDAAAKFYSEVLGFKVQRKIPPYIIQLEHDGVDVVLCQAEKPARGEYPQASATVLGIATANLKQSVERLKASKAEVLHDQPQEFPGGHFVAFRDPAGNVLELLEFSS